MGDNVNRIRELISCLPEKDAILAEKYLNKRDFQSILEIVESDLYKLENRKYNKLEEITDNSYELIRELYYELTDYISFLDINI